MTTLSTADAAELFRAAPHRVLDVGPGRVAVRSVGRGPHVLFVHGWPVSGATFRRLLPHLVDHVTCHVIDLPGSVAGRAAPPDSLSVDAHIRAVRGVVDRLGVDRLAVAGHDSGGMIVRHALAGDDRVVGMGLIDTEQPPDGGSWRFRAFVAGRRVPGFGTAFARLVGSARLRRHPLVLGGAFVDRALLDGEFEEFFLRPLVADADHRAAAVTVLRSYHPRLVAGLAELHRRIDVPVQLVWGEGDGFFPVGRARRMVGEFPDARLDVVGGAALFSHEERPAEVAAALLPVLTGDRSPAS